MHCHGIKPELTREQRVLHENDPHSNVFTLRSRFCLREMRETFVEAPTCHIRSRTTARQGLGQTCPRPRQGRHHRRRRPPHVYVYLHYIRVLVCLFFFRVLHNNFIPRPPYPIGLLITNNITYNHDSKGHIHEHIARQSENSRIILNET